MRGGCLIIDLKNVNFTSNSGITVDGVHERIESSKKPIRLCNVVVDGNEKRDIDLVNIGVKGLDYFANIEIGETPATVTITSGDVITFGTVV